MSTKLKRSELLFYVAYILWLVFAVMKLTYLKDLVPYKTINEFVENVVMVLLLLKLLDDDRHGLKGMVGIAIVGILYYVSIQAKAPGIMIPIYFIYSARNINYKDIFKVTMAIHLGVMAMSVVCSLNGIILNETWDEETRVRYSLGYTFCTYGSHISFFLTLMYISVREKIKLVEMIGLLAWNFVWYKVTDTRIDLLLCIPAIVGCYILPKIKVEVKDHWVYRSLLVAAGPVIAGVAIAGQWFFDSSNEIFAKINNVLNGRLQYGYAALHEYGVTFWGQYVKWVGRGGIRKHPDWVYNYADSSYVKYLVHYGIFFTAILLIGVMLVATVIVKEKNNGLAIAFVLWLIYGMIDAELFDLAFHPFMLLIGYAITNTCNIIKSDKKRRLLF